MVETKYNIFQFLCNVSFSKLNSKSWSNSYIFYFFIYYTIFLIMPMKIASFVLLKIYPFNEVHLKSSSCKQNVLLYVHTDRPSKIVRISWVWHFIHYLSTPLYKNSWAEPFFRGTHCIKLMNVDTKYTYIKLKRKCILFNFVYLYNLFIQKHNVMYVII